MKYYCIEFENCGFASTQLDAETHESMICPWCYSVLLEYEDHRTPWFLKKTPSSQTLVPTQGPDDE